MPRKVTINTGFTNVELPNGLLYSAGSVVILNDDDASKLAGDVFTKTFVASDGVSRPMLVDGGYYGTWPGKGVFPAVTSAGPITSTTATQSTPYGYATLAQANAIVTQINALIVDVAAIRTALFTAGFSTT